MNRADINQLHASLKNFLTKLQLMHNRWQQQIGRLQRGVVEPVIGDPAYIELHARIVESRSQFYQRTFFLWDVPNFDANNIFPADFQFLCAQIHAYLREMRHLIGKKTQVHH